MSPRRSFLVAFGASVLALAVIRGVFGGEWALRWDDGIWVGMTRRWCAGARLYADVWDNKGPLFFLWLRPMCAFDATVVKPAMLAAFWVPLLALYAIAGGRLVDKPIPAAVFGGALALLAWDNRTSELFASEKLAAGFVMLALAYRERALPALVAAALCNLRAAVLLPLLIFRPRPRRSDWALTCALVAVVCVTTLGFDRESYRWAWETLTFGSLFPGPRLAQVREHVLLGQPGVWTILLAPLGGTGAFFKLGLVAVAAPATWRTARARPEFAVGFLLTALAVFRTGITWSHTFVLFVPWIAIVAARCPVPALAVWCGLSFALEIARPERTMFRDYARADREGPRTTLTRAVAGRPWVSLLGNRYPFLTWPELPLPENRMFHSYCYAYPKWSDDQIRARIERGDVRVAIETGFDRDDCAPGPTVRWIRGRCHLGSRVGSLEIYDCQKVSLSISTTRSS